MTSIVRTFLERFPDWTKALAEHLQISLIALLIAILIGIPLASLLSKSKRWSDIVLQITGIFQTIPSLALLGLFIPLMGIGTVPAVSALVIYAIFPIIQNTITGLNGIEPSLVEAGTAFGMTKWERLKKFEIPIAMPVIMSGVRTSAVMIIGTATLASLIGAGGLGSFILLGIDRNNTDLILIGAISSALLAILFNSILQYLEKASLKKILLAFAVIVLGLLVSYSPKLVSQFTKKSETLVIAGKLGAEPEVLINIYKEIIEDQSELKVEVKSNFGKTSFLYQALKSGDIDIYPEFTGTITSSLLTSKTELSNDPKKVYLDAKNGIAKQDNLVLLKPFAYQNTYAVAVPEKLAKEKGLTKISDLKAYEGQLKAGFTLEFKDRADGYKGLQSKYGLSLPVSTMEPALRYQAIKANDIQITDAYSTDAELKKYHLKVLEDDKHLFPPYQGAPLMKKALIQKHPELKKILNQLAGKISEDQMQEMNYQVSVKGKEASRVAHDFLVKEGLIKQ
ncbi:ABC transporter permease/substrate-binding protein [Streptococcus porcinus]|uniref:ABC transporter, quaternary amine uptake transporter family, substrate-binding protein n=2 Tax=Streptococcus porcinus TaxID=1340 RepID=A0ABN0CX45_STRPO|nr:ABC transporter permease/substrate-binding protein [Streptococcus porcinus]EGJ27786.1 ABC transporter, quaternary amine uptake transporter family, substrate-binding protein [Streptococcus porcinus str. Jelinkova 176]SQG44257.1 putative ABC transporter [Streptococcus porcinus]VTT43845.1 putative ABC transporter [Streptococcus porcinus]VTT45221.1 putative ABC transporter [Streptococcus porcinus]